MPELFYTAQDLQTPITLPYDDVLAILENGTMEQEEGLMNWGSNYTFLVTVVYENTRILAVYKPRGGERPLWDFPTGSLCNREVAAYLTSEALGWRIVPPTVLRDGTRGIGSVQAFLNHDPEQHYYTFELALDKLTPQLQQVVLFDAITNNADRKGGHCLLDETEKLWGIDHGLTFNEEDKLRTVIWDYAGNDISDTCLLDIENLCEQLSQENTYQETLSTLLSQREIQALQNRVQTLLTTQQYPLPGLGPNRPWPPV